MQILKNLKFIFSILLLLLVKTPAANSTEECFEKQVEQYLNLIWL